MRRRFWPNRIFQRFRSKNCSPALTFTPVRENSSLSIKIVQNVLFTPCGGRFGQILYFNVLDPKIALPDWNLRQYVKTVAFLWKLYKTCFPRDAEDVLAKSHFSTFQTLNLLYRTEIHVNRWKQLAFYENCTKRAFHAMRKKFWPNRISRRFRSKNRSTGLKLTPIGENSRLSMKIVQNVLFTPCGGRFGQIAFFDVLGPKIALLVWNSRQ